MICIRYFRVRRDIERARKILLDAGFHAEIAEDKFEGVPIPWYGVPARYKLMVLQGDYERIAAFLAKQIKRS